MRRLLPLLLLVACRGVPTAVDDRLDVEPRLEVREERDDGDDDGFPLDVPVRGADGPWTGTADGIALTGQYAGGLVDGAWVGTHPDGTVAVRGSFARGVPTGTWRWYYPSGQLREEGAYDAGRPHGEWRMHYADGALFESLPYAAGREHGTWTVFARDGSKVEESTWVEGVRDGPARAFHGGAVVSEGRFAAGRPVGPWTCGDRTVDRPRGDDPRAICGLPARPEDPS